VSRCAALARRLRLSSLAPALHTGAPVGLTNGSRALDDCPGCGEEGCALCANHVPSRAVSEWTKAEKVPRVRVLPQRPQVTTSATERLMGKEVLTERPKAHDAERSSARRAALLSVPVTRLCHGRVIRLHAGPAIPRSTSTETQNATGRTAPVWILLIRDRETPYRSAICRVDSGPVSNTRIVST
jgi:hypothetical protein